MSSQDNAPQLSEHDTPDPDKKEEQKPELQDVPLEELFAAESLEVDVDAMPVKSESDQDTAPVKQEDIGGDIEVKLDDEGRPLLSRNPTLKAVKKEPILWNHVESASEEAALAFQELDYCVYQSASLGSTGQEEVMSCDCKPDFGPDGENYACGDDSDCINRLTSMECTDDECSCGSRCANQRFQLREYANVDVFHAGKKGYGLRALSDLDKNTFVYEYIGEVINERRFRQRQREYEEQGEKHFYFMMLQKGEYIDATRKGGFGRFINHSCEPNCYVDKWVVGNKLRMGIFTKKVIVKGEELSFDYNVDRYGGEATPCYCGEPTCLGYIGGKTQTEAANKLPQSVVEALGIDDDDEWDNAKPKNSKRRKKGQDDEEYVNELVPRAILEKDVPKIMAALMQASERWLLKKLLQRVCNDGNENIQSKIVALHGYQTLGAKIEKWKHDQEISTLILQVLQKWPTITKNKIMSSKIETHVKALIDDEAVAQEVKDISKELLDTWSTLEMAYRIPRRVKPPKPENGAAETQEKTSNGQAQADAAPKAPRLPLQVRALQRPRGPRNPSYRSDQSWRRHDSSSRGTDSNGRPYSALSTPSSQRMSTATQSSTPQPQTSSKIDPISQDLQAIIDAATKKQQEQAAAQKAQEEKLAAEESARLEAEAQKRADRIRRHQEHKASKEKRAAEKRQHHKDRKDRHSSKASSDAKKTTTSGEAQKRFEHMLARFVPNVIAKYQDKLGKEHVKRRAKEIVKLLVAKEMKKETPNLSELSDAKKSKIKQYAREFMDKVVARAPSTPHHSNGKNDTKGVDKKDDSDAASPGMPDDNPDSASDTGSDSPEPPTESDVELHPPTTIPQKRVNAGAEGEEEEVLQAPSKQAKISIA